MQKGAICVLPATFLNHSWGVLRYILQVQGKAQSIHAQGITCLLARQGAGSQRLRKLSLVHVHRMDSRCAGLQAWSALLDCMHRAQAVRGPGHPLPRRARGRYGASSWAS